MHPRVRLFSLLLWLAPAVAWGQGSVEYSLSTSPTGTAASAVPNTSWAATPYENAPPTYPDDDDWEWAGNAPLAFYLVPEAGATFAAVDATLTWDPAVIQFTGVDASGGLFDGAGGALFSISEAAGQLRINASRLDNQNLTAAATDYVARIDFELLTPGYTAVGLTGLDVRTVDGVGGQAAVPTTATAGALRAYLGDVAATGDATTGDGLVDFEDLTVFADAYYAGTAAVGGSLDRYKVKLDLGPTTDGSVFSDPVPDQQIEFEDLVIFALSYARSQQGVYLREAASDGAPAPVAVRLGEAVAEAGDVVVEVQVEGAMDLRAFAFEARLDPLLEFVEVRQAVGGLGNGLFVTGRAAEGTLYLDGAALTEQGVSGSGAVLMVRLRPRSGQSPGVALALTGARLRTSRNVPIPARLDARPDSPAPVETGLALPYPNPVRGSVLVPYAVSEVGPVAIHVFDPLGRRIATLVDAPQAQGAHEARWDAAGWSPGTYLVHFEAGGLRQTRTLTLLP